MADLPAHRAVDAAVALRGADGQALASTPVSVRQVRHAFGFGCNAFDAVPLADGEVPDDELRAAEAAFGRWLDLFDQATLPFYWARFEPEEGRPDTARLRRTAEWLVAQGCRVKGHPLAWHTLAPEWLLGRSDDAVLDCLRDRITREVAGFAGVIDTWDVVNEAVIMPVFDRYPNAITPLAQRLGRVGIVAEAFAAAREANPGATLLLNDFDLSPAHERLIEECLDAGVGIDALGLQSHMHQGWWGVERTLDLIERFSRFGLPLHWTETTIISGDLMPPDIVDLNDFQVASWPSTPDGEARQAEEVVAHYRALFEAPSVQAIVWWDLRDGNWLNAPSGLLRADGSAKPAWHALHDLIRGEWWTPPTTVVTDEAGVVRWRGTLGAYEIAAGDGSATVTLDRAGAVEVGAQLGAG